MSYSTETQVRDEAGFTDNANVVAAQITAYITASDSHIDAALRNLYTLPLDSTPEIIRLISQKLAAGHLLLDEYGAEAEGTDQDGQKKVDWAQSMLDQIATGTLQLVGSDGVTLAKSESLGMSGWPNSSTDETDTADGDKLPKFRMDEEF